MKAAKENDAVTAEQYARESIRIARTTRELLKKFSLAHHVYHNDEGEALLTQFRPGNAFRKRMRMHSSTPPR